MSFWVPHEEAVFLPGKLAAEDVNGNNEYLTDVGRIAIPTSKTLENIVDFGVLEGINDVCMLNNVDDASVLHTLRVRYLRDEIYTYISCILIAINPFKPLNLCTSHHVEQYRSSLDVFSLPPHIFGLTSAAFMRLSGHNVAQAMLISGESGAGKTETTKFVLQYASEVLRSEAGLADKLLQLNPILEAFGNAKTVRNNNSSRFGKWIEVGVTTSTMSLSGASVTDYLLEVTRVCTQGPGDRNYHIFYQLCHADVRADWPKLKLADPSEFHYLKRNPSVVPEIDDTAEFRMLREGLTAMNFSETEEEEIFHIIAGVLHVGNLEFDDEGVEASKLRDVSALTTVAEVLQCDEQALRNCVLFKRRVTGKEVFMSPLDPKQARGARDAVAKMIYGRLFQMLVTRCNAALKLMDTGASKPPTFFGVLDIAGFESFETNMLEQLFINFSNEKLQQFFNNSVFKKELAEYTAEGVPIAKINYKDNQSVLDLIEGQMGLLPMLDDATTGVRQTDEQYTTKIIKQHDKHENFFKPKFVKDAPLCFGIKHYAGEVMYTAELFLEKNVATAAPEVVELMAGSQLGILKLIGEETGAAAAKLAQGTKKVRTVGGGFRSSLQSLIEKLNCSEPNFVRCIKPNHAKVPKKYTGKMVLEQLRLSGAMETVKIRKAGFLMRPPMMEFLRRYIVILPKDKKWELMKSSGSKKDSHPSPETNLVQAANGFIGLMPLVMGETIDDKLYAIGKTKVFVKSDLYRKFEEYRRGAFVLPSIVIQRWYRGYATRKVMSKVIELNESLKVCVAQTGNTEKAGVNVLKKDVRRATAMEGSLSHMSMLISEAMELPIKLPRLPEFIQAQATLDAQASLARQLSDSLTSVRLTEMEALVSRADGYGMAGELVEKLRLRCGELLKQLPLRRALQNCCFCDAIGDARAIIRSVREAGFADPEKWLLPDGRECWEAANAQLEKLEEEHKEKARAIDDAEKNMRDLEVTQDVTSMQALLAQSSALNMTGEAVDALKKRCAALRQQRGAIDRMRSCAPGGDVEAVEAALAALKEEGLSDPAGWILPEGATLQVRLARLLMELKLAQQCTTRITNDLDRRVADLQPSEDLNSMQSLLKHPCISSGNAEAVDALRQRAETLSKKPAVSEEDTDLVGIWPEWQLKLLECSLEAVPMQVFLGDELLARLKEHCAKLQVQFTHQKALQASIVSSDLKCVEKTLRDLDVAGLAGPEAWVIKSGPRLTTAAKRRRDELEAEDKARAETEAKITMQMEELSTSCDVFSVQRVIIMARANELPDSNLLTNLEARNTKLQQQFPLCRALRRCIAVPDLEAVRRAISDAKEGGFSASEAWILPEGPASYAAAVEHLQKAESVQERIVKAADVFDSEGLRAAFNESENLGFPMTEFPEASDLFMKLQEKAFVESKLSELHAASIEDPTQQVKIENLLTLLEDSDGYHSEVLRQPQFQRAATRPKDAKEGAILMRPSCAAFIKRYLAILPTAARSELLAAAGSTSATAVTPETDLVKGARALVKALVSQEGGPPLKEADAIVGKSNVFLNATACRALEEALGSALSKNAVKVQAAYRGKRTRAIGGPHIKEALVVKKDLETCTAEAKSAAQENNRERMAKCITTMDESLKKAARLKHQVPELKRHLEARASLAADAKMVEHLESLMTSLDVSAMAAALARAAGQGMDGPAVTALRERREKLQTQLLQRRVLRCSIALTDISEVQKTTDEAKAIGLDAAENWLLPDGHEAWTAATARLTELKEDNQRLGGLPSLDERLKASSTCHDSLELRVLLFEAKLAGTEGEELEKLQTRCDAFTTQKKVSGDLLGCAASFDAEAVAGSIARAEEAVGAPEAWLLPAGKQRLMRAKRRLLRLQEDAAAKATAGVDMIAQAEDQLLSYEPSSMRAVLSSMTAWYTDAGVLQKLAERAESLEKQVVVCDKLRACRGEKGALEETLTAAKEAGLGSAESWLLPDGARLLARVSARLEMLKQIESIPKDMKLEKQEEEAVDALRKCTSADITADAVKKAVADARAAGLDVLRKWPDPNGYSLLSLAVSLQDQFAEEQEEVSIANGDLDWQRRKLQGFLVVPSLTSALGEEFVGLMSGRCDDAGKQLPARRELQLCATYDEHSAAEAAVSTVKALGEPEKWVVPDGPRLLAMAMSRAERLKEKEKAAEGFKEEIEQQLKDLQTSLELPALYAAVARSETCSVNKDLVAATKERIEAVESQLSLRVQLQSCAVSEEFKDVEKIILDAKAAGLDSPDKWLLPDGPKLFIKAVSRQNQLQEAETVKSSITTAAARLDAQELLSLLSRANDLGLRRASYAEAHALFLNLYRGDFVIDKIKELRKHCQEDVMFSLMISNLSAQLDVLGLKTDSAAMQEVTKELMSAQRKSRTKSMFDSSIKTHRDAAQKCFADVAHFTRLRDPLNWGTTGLATDTSDDKGDAIGRGRYMLSFNPECIVMSLTELPPELDQEAVTTFMELLRCMGDKPQTTSCAGDKEAPVIEAAKKSEQMADEVYIQVMKQLTDNPSTTSATSGWELFAKLCSEVQPSGELREFIRGFLQKSAKAKDVAEEEDESLRQARKSVRAETDMRSKSRRATVVNFATAIQPQLASEALEAFLSAQQA